MSLLNEVNTLLYTVGLPIAFLIIFAESSLIFFLPGDSFIIAAALFAADGSLNIWWLLVTMFIAAITGNSLGYYLGQRYGTRLFSKKNSVLFDKQHIERSEHFYAKYGPVTILLARFVPMVRTLAPVLAGVGKMNYSMFLRYNIAGAILWVFGLGLVSYYAGKQIPNIDRYVLPIIGIIILASLLPALKAFLAQKKKRAISGR